MHPSYEITRSGIAGALAGIAKSVNQPAKKIPDYSRQRRVMARAWEIYRAKQAAELKDIELYRAEASPEQFERWFKRTTTFNAKQFGFSLQNAHRAISIEDRGPVYITDERSREIGSDSRFSDRRGV